MSSATERPAAEIRTIEETLARNFPREAITAYRYNPASIRVRIVDSRFAGLGLVERMNLLDPLVRSLPEAIQADLLMLLLLAPEEVDASLSNEVLERRRPVRL